VKRLVELTHHFRSWLPVFSKPTPWAQLIESQIILAATNLTVFTIGAAIFQTRDIKS